MYIRTQCKLENKLSNKGKIIIKIRCYFLAIFRSLPLLFQNKCVNQLHGNFQVKTTFFAH